MTKEETPDRGEPIRGFGHVALLGALPLGRSCFGTLAYWLSIGGVLCLIPIRPTFMGTCGGVGR